MSEIRQFASDRGIKPATVLQQAAGLSGTTWAKWEAGTSSCTLQIADRIRAYMKERTASEAVRGAA